MNNRIPGLAGTAARSVKTATTGLVPYTDGQVGHAQEGVTSTPAITLIRQGDTSPVMPLASGKPFKVFRPCPLDITPEDIAHSLGNQCRFNGHCIEFYSTGQHSTIVAALLPPERLDLQLEALFHDGDESLGLPDLITPVKVRMDEFRARQKQSGQAVAKRFELPQTESKEVKHADLVALEMERRDNLNPPIGFKWRDTGARPSPVRIVPMDPRPARKLFLDAYRRLEAGLAITFEWLGTQGAVDPASIPSGPACNHDKHDKARTEMENAPI